MKAKFWTAVVIFLLVIMLAAVFTISWRYLTVDDLVARVIGACAMVIGLVGAWVLLREVLFGYNTEKLGRILDREGGLPEDTVARSPGGRPNKEQADEQFSKYATAAEAEPADWRSWFRLSIAYDVASDRTRARKMMRKAIAMYREG